MKQDKAILEYTTDHTLSPNDPGSSEPLIKLEGVSRSFAEAGQQRPVLRAVSITFAAGQTVAIMGKSGTGKSTLLNLISGIDRPTSGHIHVGGQIITQLSEHERTLFRRWHIGFIFQFFNLVPTLTVLENLLLPLELKGHPASESAQLARALLDQVGLADRSQSYPDRLSGGEQQRVAIARALVHDPLLVLADEPTGNLDAETSQQVLTLIDSLIRQMGKTLLVVTHSQDVARLADRVLRLQDGHLVDATPVSPGHMASDG